MTDGTKIKSQPVSAHEAITPRQQILHDLRNCLYTIRNGLEVLQASRSGNDSAAVVIRMMQAEESKANRLLQDYEQLTSGDG